MTKKLSILLVIALILSFTFCFAGCDKDTNSLPDDNSQPTVQDESNTTSTESKDETTSETTPDKVESSKPSTSSDKTSSQSKPTQTSSQQKPAEPQKLNPKTNIKFDEYYYGEFFSTDNKIYSKLNFTFHDSGEFGYSYEFNLTTYYTKDRCIEKLAQFDMEFDEQEFKNSTITVNGVTYYTLDWLNYSSARLCEFTDTAITLRNDEAPIATLSLRNDGTLVIDSIKSDEFGPVGTVFKTK